jgi:hypothetical protein
MGVEAPDVPANFDGAQAYIRAKVPNFRTYTSWGHDESIIGGYYDAVLAKNALDNRRPGIAIITASQYLDPKPSCRSLLDGVSLSKLFD